MKGGRRIRPLEILVIVGIALALIMPAWQKAAERKGEAAAPHADQEIGLMEEAETAQSAKEAARRPTTPEIVKVGGFVFMAILVPTLMIRQWLRQRRRCT